MERNRERGIEIDIDKWRGRKREVKRNRIIYRLRWRGGETGRWRGGETGRQMMRRTRKHCREREREREPTSSPPAWFGS